MKKICISILLVAVFVFTACTSTPPVSKGTKMSRVESTPDVIVGTNNVIKWQYRQLYLKGNAMSSFVIGDWYIYRQVTFSNGVVIADERFQNPNFPTQ